MSSSEQSPLPPVRRVVTGTQQDGKAYHVKDEKFATELIGHRVGFKVLYRTEECPAASNAEPFVDPMDTPTTNITTENGMVCRVCDFPPHGDGLWHRTLSVDVGIVISGEIYHGLDGGEEKLLKAGDVVIQRGTNHSWINRSSNWTRMYFILTAAKPVEINGETLGEFGYDPKSMASGGI